MKPSQVVELGKLRFLPLPELALASYWDFIKLIEFKGGVENFGAIHKELTDYITKPQPRLLSKTTEAPARPTEGNIRRRLVLMPRGHLKSTLCSVGYVLWRIWRNPNIRIAVCSATKDLSLQFIREIKQYLEDEDLQERVWNNRPHIQGRLIPVLDKVAARRRDRLRWDENPDFTEAADKKIVWRSDAVQVMRDTIMKEPTLLSASPGANITGMHFDLIVMDDIINDDSVATDTKVEKTLEWAQDLESVIDPQRMVCLGSAGDYKYFEVVGDEALVLGTRYAKNDYYDYLLSNVDMLEYTTFVRNIYKNGEDKAEGYLWAEKFNDEVLERIKKRQSAKRFASQYLNKIIADEDVIFKLGFIQYFLEADCECKDGYVTWSKKDDNGILKHYRVKPIIMIDPAISEKKTADYTVLAVGGQDVDRNLYIFDVKFGRFLPDTIIENLYFLVKKWSVNVCHVETVGYQKALVHIIKASFKKHHPIVVNEYLPKGNKKARIETYLEPLFTNKQIFLERKMSGLAELREELTYFPSETVKDDIIDTFAMIVEITNPTAQANRRSNLLPFKPLNRKYGGSR